MQDLLSETTTVQRTATTYDIGITGTGRELGFVQFTESTTSPDLMTRTERIDTTYSAGRVYGYEEGSRRYSEGDGGSSYSITTTTARVETT